MSSDPAGEVGAPQWGARHAFYALLAGIVAAVMAGAVVTGVVGRELNTLELIGIASTVQFGATFAVVYGVSRSLGTGSLEADFGLRTGARDAWGLALGVLLQILLALSLLPVLDLLDLEEAPQDVVRRTQETTDPAIAVVVLLAVGFAGPVVEEILFRGLLLRALRRHYSRSVAVALSAAAFSLVHLLDPGAAVVVPQLFAVGVVLAVMADRRGDLGLAIFTHMGFNLTAVVVLLVAAG